MTSVFQSFQLVISLPKTRTPCTDMLGALRHSLQEVAYRKHGEGGWGVGGGGVEAFPRTGRRDEIKGFVFTYRVGFVSTVKSNGEGGRRISVFPFKTLIIRHGWCARRPLRGRWCASG